MSRETTIHLGYEVGTGNPVSIPLAHTFVTGQTQLSGKTTTLRAIVERSGLCALAFVTKRGEQFDGRRIKPYLPREGEQPIHWRLVETILASALGQRSMKYERFWLVNASKGARSLADVRRNVDRLKAKAKGNTADVYELIGEYIDLVLPEMRALAAAETLDLRPGLNVMDLAGVGPQLQALVIRAALERINQHERGILTVFPEAWEFAPRSRSAPAKDEAIAMARKGAVLGNYLLCDSQDIAGVDTVVRQAASVWILGVQRELNELKRTLASIPASISKPKATDIATLECGQFFACWGRHVVKTYVQPTWMDAGEARSIAQGNCSIPKAPEPQKREEDEAVTKEEADELRAENRRLAERVAELQDQLSGPRGRSEASDRTTDRTTASSNGHYATIEAESFYQTILARLLKEPKIIRLTNVKSEIEVRDTIERIETDGKSLRGRIAKLIVDGFFAQSRTSANVLDELLKRGADRPSNIELGNEMKSLCDMGFFTRENKWYSFVPDAKVNVIKK